MEEMTHTNTEEALSTSQISKQTQPTLFAQV